MAQSSLFPAAEWPESPIENQILARCAGARACDIIEFADQRSGASRTERQIPRCCVHGAFPEWRGKEHDNHRRSPVWAGERDRLARQQ